MHACIESDGFPNGAAWVACIYLYLPVLTCIYLVEVMSGCEVGLVLTRPVIRGSSGVSRDLVSYT